MPTASTRQDFAEDETCRERDQHAAEGVLLDVGGYCIGRLVRLPSTMRGTIGLQSAST